MHRHQAISRLYIKFRRLSLRAAEATGSTEVYFKVHRSSRMPSLTLAPSGWERSPPFPGGVPFRDHPHPVDVHTWDLIRRERAEHPAPGALSRDVVRNYGWVCPGRRHVLGRRRQGSGVVDENRARFHPARSGQGIGRGGPRGPGAKRAAGRLGGKISPAARGGPHAAPAAVQHPA